MTAFQIFVAIGMCSGFVPNDPGLTEELCFMQYQASIRILDWLHIQGPEYPDLPSRKRPTASKEFREYA